MSRLSALLSRSNLVSSIFRVRASALACSPRVNQMRTKITDAGTIESPFPPVVIPELSIPEYIWKNVEQWEDKPCVVSGFVLINIIILRVYISMFTDLQDKRLN